MGILDFRRKVRIGAPHPEERRAIEGYRNVGQPRPEMIRAVRAAKGVSALRQNEYERTRAWIGNARISEERRAEALQDLEDASHEIKDAGKATAAFRGIRQRNDLRRL